MTMTARSLLSKLLVRATKKWPTDKSFNNHLADLYASYVNKYNFEFQRSACHYIFIRNC